MVTHSSSTSLSSISAMETLCVWDDLRVLLGMDDRPLMVKVVLTAPSVALESCMAKNPGGSPEEGPDGGMRAAYPAKTLGGAGTT